VDGKRKFVLIDARMPEEYGESHIPRAINIPVEQMIFQGGMPEWTSKGFPVRKGFRP
jgi:rhodanese-related sulfurtransferase